MQLVNPFNNPAGESDGAKSMKGLARVIAILVILGVSTFGDVMYIIEVSRIFSGQGILLVFCYIGAISGVLTVCYLLIGKLSVFRPGGQMTAAWIVTGMEMVIVALNVMYAFNTPGLGAWGYVSPATPVLHLIGLTIVFFADPDLKVKHRQMELKAKLEIADLELQFAVDMAKIGLKHQHLNHTVKALAAAGNSDAALATIEEHATSINSQLLTEMSGRAPSSDKNEKGYGSRY